MLALYGTGVSSGITIGEVHVLRRERPEIPEYVLPKNLIDDEINRFVQAVEAARQQLRDIREHIPAGAPPETVNFIDTHLLILEDSMLCKDPIETIRKEQTNAEWALKLQAEILTGMFEQIDDPYIRSKKDDVSQVTDRIIRNLLGQDAPDHTSISSGQIIVANDLSPADTVMLKHNRIKGFVTNLGGPISHTAILARSLDIPAIVSVHNATRLIQDSETVIIDGKRGVIIVGADKDIVAEYKKQQRHIGRIKQELDNLRRGPATTLDGKKISLQANIELPADVKAATRAAAQGIGLYRTEFLYMNRSSPPTEEEQLNAYSKVVKALPGKVVTIRTLDLGADKQVDGGGYESAVVINPALGLRAVRLCLQSPDLFKPQLRAIIRASEFGKIQIMIPMLSSPDELFRVLDLIEETKKELKSEGKKFRSRIPVGGMIEVPAAAIAADLFAPHLDFLSIGTNDLIQYTLAIDRVDDAVNYLYNPLHPAVLRLISNTINAGQAAGIPVAMCGEMAGDIRYTRLLLGLGLTEFSMHPATLLNVKKVIRNTNYESAKKFARKIMRLRDNRELQAQLEEFNESCEPQ